MNASNLAKYLIAGAFLCVTRSPLGVAAVRPKEVAADALPGVWAQVPVQERLKALRAAEVDGTRLLLERIMGLHVGSETTVRVWFWRMTRCAGS